MTSSLPSGPRRWLLLAGMAWLALMGLVWWLGHQLTPTWFDPARAAPHAFNKSANVEQLMQALTELDATLPRGRPLFIRFSQPDCPCERFVEDYHQLMIPLLQKQGLHPVTIEPAQMQQLAEKLGDSLWEWVPSTPSILLLTKDHQVAYYGPYHQAGICNSENSYLEPVLDALKAGQPVNIINTLVEGCFCPYPSIKN